MKTEALSKFLDVLREHVHDQDAESEIDNIRNKLNTCQDISRGVEALCRSFSLLFTLDPAILAPGCPLWKSIRPVSNEALSWLTEKDKILRAVDALQASGRVDKVNACFIRALLARNYDLQRAARWSEVAGSIAEKLNRCTQISWSQCISGCIRIIQGNDLRDKGYSRAAERAYEQARELWPRWPGSWFGLGLSRLERGKLHEALSACKEGLKMDPGDWYGWDGIATAYLRLRNLEEAEKAARDGIEASREKGKVYYALGCVQAAMGEWLPAISSYCEALSLEREDTCIWNDLGIAYERIGWYDKAVTALCQAIALSAAALRQVTASPGSCTSAPFINLIRVLVKMGQLSNAAEELQRCLTFELARAEKAHLWVARDFDNVARSELLTHYDLVAGIGFPDKPPGCGKHIVDQYLIRVQDCLTDGLKSKDLDDTDVITGLLYIGMLWTLYAKKLSQKGLSKQFARERLYAIKHELFEGLPKQAMRNGFTSAWPELEARIGTTSLEEFAQEMLKQESMWLQSVGKRQERGEVEDLRFGLKGHLWVHVNEYEKEHRFEHLEMIHYYMELLKGQTILHKLVNPKMMRKVTDRRIWNRYANSLPVKVDRTAVISLESCTAKLPNNAVAMSFYFLRRTLLPDKLLVIILKPGEGACLKVIEAKKRLERFQDAARCLKRMHHKVAWQPKVPTVRQTFYELSGQRKELKAREFISALVEWEKKQLHQAYNSIIEGIIDVKELQGKDLYISPSPEMYEIPFSLLLSDNEFLNSIVKSITIVPIFSLRQFQRKGYFPKRDGLVLCLDERWEDEAKFRADCLANTWCSGSTSWKIERELRVFKGEVRLKYDGWIRAMRRIPYVHVIGHNDDASQWSLPTKQEPNLAQFGRYLYEAPERLFADVICLEACWGGTWSEPEDLMGLFVSFLASGVSHVVASPYSLVPAGTSGKLFDGFYTYNSEIGNQNLGLQMARTLRDVAEEARFASFGSEGTIPTLWGALQLYAAV